MRKLDKKDLFVYTIICFISFELILQIAGFFILLKTEKQNLSKSGDFNILCVGDSFTYGLGAPREESYPSQLERILSNTYPQKHIKVINLGIPGYNSSQCLKYLKEKFDFYNPKIILVMSGMNNCWSFIDSSYFKIKQANHNRPLNFRGKFIDASLSRLKTYKLIKIAFINIIDRLRLNKLQYYQDPPLPKKEFRMPLRSDELTELLSKGVRYFEEGKYDLSEVCYRKALELSPDDYEPHWYMGRFYIYKGQIEKAKEELILAARLAPDPRTLVCILSNLQDMSQSINSKHFKEYADLIKKQRSGLVEKFGEEYIQWLIDPVISYKENDLEKVLAYDFEKMADYVKQKGAKLVILTYPWPAYQFRFPINLYSIIASYLELPVIDNVSLFNKYLEIYKRQDLFSADGHCTNKGYGFMAENVANVLKKYNLLN